MYQLQKKLSVVVISYTNVSSKNRAFYEHGKSGLDSTQREAEGQRAATPVHPEHYVGARCILWLDVVTAVEPHRDVAAGRMRTANQQTEDFDPHRDEIGASARVWARPCLESKFYDCFSDSNRKNALGCLLGIIDRIDGLFQSLFEAELACH